MKQTHLESCDYCLRVYTPSSQRPPRLCRRDRRAAAFADADGNKTSRECVRERAQSSLKKTSRKQKRRLTSLVVKVDMLLRQGQAEMERVETRGDL